MNHKKTLVELSMTTPEKRVENALREWKNDVIKLDPLALGKLIHDLILDRGQLKTVSPGDLHVYETTAGVKPKDVMEAVRDGTKFFDAIYYFAAEESMRPGCKQRVEGLPEGDNAVSSAVDCLLWTALYLMIRGSYGQSAGTNLGSDIPAFIAGIAGMNISPKECSSRLASFAIEKVSPLWIKSIDWKGFAPEIKQRLGLGIAGYRMLGPFRCYKPRVGASEEAVKAYAWVKQVCERKLDYGLLSCTRDASLVSRLGSFNNSLGQLMLACFTNDQLEEMKKLKIIYSVPIADARYNNWMSWDPASPLELNDPIGLN